mmetsp:Transcript_20198/g.43138  ORF Transcript_20198/g.43138 Transcript_20198/m.43138 type:complete len:173 (-) Transcript_20198:375-893(-)
MAPLSCDTRFILMLPKMLVLVLVQLVPMVSTDSLGPGLCRGPLCRDGTLFQALGGVEDGLGAELSSLLKIELLLSLEPVPSPVGGNTQDGPRPFRELLIKPSELCGDIPDDGHTEVRSVEVLPIVSLTVLNRARPESGGGPLISCLALFRKPKDEIEADMGLPPHTEALTLW